MSLQTVFLGRVLTQQRPVERTEVQSNQRLAEFSTVFGSFPQGRNPRISGESVGTGLEQTDSTEDSGEALVDSYVTGLNV